MSATVQTLLRHIERRLIQTAAGGDDAVRLFHGRGQCHEGLLFVNVDWYAPVALVTLYSEEGELMLDPLLDGLSAKLGARLSCMVVQRRHLPEAPSEVVFGRLPDRLYAREAGLRYRLRLGEAQNIGFFSDMRRGRALVRALAPGRAVLNLFAYTCSFSVAALAGGADRVVNLDMSRTALAVGRENHRYNGLEHRRATFLAHDLFKSFGKLKRLGPFGIIVIDPPTEQGTSFSARTGWPKLARRLAQWAAPGADVVACLNAPQLGPEFLRELFARELPGATLVETLGPPDDFPEKHPERGLNILHFRLDSNERKGER